MNLPVHYRECTLRDICQAIARTLNSSNIIRADFEKKLMPYRLNQQRTLLIIDNLETLDEQEIVLDFLQNLPLTVKAVITTRLQTDFHRTPLEYLPLHEGLDLIQQQAKAKGVNLLEEDASAIYKKKVAFP